MIDDFYERLQIIQDFSCDKGRDYPSRYECKKCKFFYINSYHASSCLKKEIGDWALHNASKKEKRK